MAGNLSDPQSSDSGVISAINITPFVDVTLVLLVIFIVTAPTIFKETLNVKLPKAATSDGRSASSFAVAITRQGQILVDGQLCTEQQLTEAAQKALQQNPEAQAVLVADADAKHGEVVRVIDLIKTAGLNHFAIQIQH